jgi:hypothetical protein
MNIYKNIFNIIYMIIGLLVLANIPIHVIAQDTLAGNYPMLTIRSGIHVIKETVTVKGKLEIQAGAKIEFADPGVLVCEGEVSIQGEKNNKIEIYGKPLFEGVGLVIRNIDSITTSKIEINNTIFKSLQLPILFDFGWKRAGVNISDNFFINNTGKVSVIQVLNPPFNFKIDSNYIDFKVQHNLFSDNNAAIYFEDLKSDHVNIDISNNTFYGNNIYGYKNYNISTNILYGRVDQSFSRFSSIIENNSFVFNYLIDNISDTVVHAANFGVYGSDKKFSLKNNYLGSSNKADILTSIYDQTISYSSPKIDFEPFLTSPSESSPAHIYAVSNLDNSLFFDTVQILEPLKGFILKSNIAIDYSKSVLKYSYFKDDSSLTKIDTVLTYDIQPNSIEAKFSITKSVNAQKKSGYYNLTKMTSSNGEYVPDVKIGYVAYLNELRRRNLIAEILKDNKLTDTIQKPVPPADSLKNTFQKIEAPLKSRFEIGLLTGGSFFLGTVSSKGNLFSNDRNMLLGLNINYTLYSNLSAGLNIESFKLSNSDANSNNNDQLARGMTFSTTMLSVSPSIHYDFVDNRLYTKARRIRPSIGFGLDIVSFNPTGIYNGTVYNLEPLGTGGQYSDSTKKPYSLLAFGYFVSFKVKYQINRFNSIGLHLSYHKSMSNYLDDVGPDSYPTVSAINNSNKITNKDAAIYFSNPTSRNVASQYRNNPDDASDSYLNFGIYYSRRLFK